VSRVSEGYKYNDITHNDITNERLKATKRMKTVMILITNDWNWKFRF